MTSSWLPKCTTWRRRDLGHYKLDVGGELVAIGIGSGMRTTAYWALTSTPDRPTPSSSTAATLGPACEAWSVKHEWRELKLGCKLQPKVNAGLTIGLGWAPRRFTGMADLFHCWGLSGTGRGARMWRLNTVPPSERPKVNGGQATGACWAPQAVKAVNRDRWLHCMSLPNRGPMQTPLRPPAR